MLIQIDVRCTCTLTSQYLATLISTMLLASPGFHPIILLRLSHGTFVDGGRATRPRRRWSDGLLVYGGGKTKPRRLWPDGLFIYGGRATEPCRRQPRSHSAKMHRSSCSICGAALPHVVELSSGTVIPVSAHVICPSRTLPIMMIVR